MSEEILHRIRRILSRSLGDQHGTELSGNDHNLNTVNQPNNQYSTLSTAVEALKKQGYSDELVHTEAGLFNHKRVVEPERFAIDSFHRFEGPSDPADMGIVYAVSSLYYGLKGLLIGAFGTYSTSIIHKMVQAIPEHEREGNVQPVQPAPTGESIKV